MYGVRAEEVDYIRYVFDAVGQISGSTAVAVHGGRDVLFTNAPGAERRRVVLVLDFGRFAGGNERCVDWLRAFVDHECLLRQVDVNPTFPFFEGLRRRARAGNPN